MLQRCLPGEPLEIGLGPQREAIVQTLIAQTDTYRIQVLDQNAKTTGWLTRSTTRKRYSASDLARMTR